MVAKIEASLFVLQNYAKDKIIYCFISDSYIS
jgi:hypothetical protein